MPRKREITKVESFLSIRTLVRTGCDECATDEDAVAFIEEGLVKINGTVTKDPYYGVNGAFAVQIKNRALFDRDYHPCADKYMKGKLLSFANQPQNLSRLRQGEVISYVRKETRTYYGGIFHLSLSPPDFTGSTLIACYLGDTRQSSQTTSAPFQAVTECGARV